MKLRFLGTRGYIDAASRRHRRHSALLVGYRGSRVMVDCGEDWLGRVAAVRPHAIVLTHGHPDHAGGLRHGSPVPVYAPRATWRTIERYPIDDRRTLAAGRARRIRGISLRPFDVEHSLHCPAVGYRVTAGGVAVWYGPDVVYVRRRRRALRGTRLYVGDGASPQRPLVRRRGERLIGHAPIRRQITWCAKEGIPRAIFTHCGSPIVTGDERTIGAQIRRWGRQHGVEASLARDGQEIVLR